jgi:predicted TIM-barrel fold metal-dependent hydrolase
MLFGGGVAWLPSLLWRFDAQARSLRRDVPWLTRLPSEYASEHVWVSTYPLDRPADPGRMAVLLKTFPALEQRLCFASGYPRWDADRPDEIEPRVPAEWLSRILHDNALELYGQRL